MRLQATILAGIVAVVVLCLVVEPSQAHRDYDYEGGEPANRQFQLDELGDLAVDFICKAFGESLCAIAKQLLDIVKQGVAKDRKLSDKIAAYARSSSDYDGSSGRRRHSSYGHNHNH